MIDDDNEKSTCKMLILIIHLSLVTSILDRRVQSLSLQWCERRLSYHNPVHCDSKHGCQPERFHPFSWIPLSQLLVTSTALVTKLSGMEPVLSDETRDEQMN